MTIFKNEAHLTLGGADGTEGRKRGSAETRDNVLNWQPIYKSAIWTL